MTVGGRGGQLAADGINSARALILHAYFGLRRSRAAEQIGTSEVISWIRMHEPDEPAPSASLVQLTLDEAGVSHRARGRPATNTDSSPLFWFLRNSWCYPHLVAT
jgi:hypothetical protein